MLDLSDIDKLISETEKGLKFQEETEQEMLADENNFESEDFEFVTWSITHLSDKIQLLKEIKRLRELNGNHSK